MRTLCLAAALLCLLGAASHPVHGGETSAEDAWWTLFDAARAHQEAGRLDEARLGFEEAERYAVAKHLDPNYVKASIAGRIECFHAVYDYVGLRDTSLHMLEVARATEPAVDVFDTLLDLGYFETQLGDPVHALRWLEEAASMVGDDPAQAADVHLRVALAQNSRGQFTHALEAGEQATAYFRKAEDDSSLASALSILALIYRGLGEYEKAGECVEQALLLIDETEDFVLHADLLTTRASLHLSAGDLDAARETLAEARKLFESGNERLATANVIYLQATVLDRQGHPEDALACFEEAAAMAGPASPVATEMGVRIGWSLGRLGRHDEARVRLQASLDLAVATGDLRVIADASALLAADHAERGEDEEACERLSESLDALAELARGLSPVTRARAVSVRSFALATIEETAFDLADSCATLELLDRTRATTLTAGLGRTVAAPASADPEIERAREQVAAALARRTAAQMNGALSLIRPAEEAYRKARGAYRDALRDAQRTTRPERLRAGEAALSVEGVQATLRPEEALVLYAFLEEGGLHAFVVERAATRRVALGSTADLRPRIEEVRHALDGPGELPARAPLEEALIGKLELSADVTRLLVCPDDVLAAVPFAWIAEGREVVFVPSATAYGLLQTERGRRGTGVLAIADPAYAGPPGGVLPGVRSGMLAPLEHARAEAKAITREKAIQREEDVLLLDEEATEAALRRVLPTRERWHALHFACHGLLDEQQPSWSSLALSSSEGDDGLLSVIEIMGMRMPTDLAVLSACDTGLGRRLAGEGMLGLASAFLYAGAPRVVASLWKVDDEATQAFMQAFYAAWNPEKGHEAKGAAEALRLAQETLRDSKQWSHPHYWAGWVLWGLPD